MIRWKNLNVISFKETCPIVIQEENLKFFFKKKRKKKKKKKERNILLNSQKFGISNWLEIAFYVKTIAEINNIQKID